MFSYKIFRQGGDTLLAVADLSILGKNLKEDDLEIDVSKDFYGGETCSEDEIKRLIKSATIINALGKSIISLLLDEKIVDKENILYIAGVPHAQVISVL